MCGLSRLIVCVVFSSSSSATSVKRAKVGGAQEGPPPDINDECKLGSFASRVGRIVKFGNPFDSSGFVQFSVLNPFSLGEAHAQNENLILDGQILIAFKEVS